MNHTIQYIFHIHVPNLIKPRKCLEKIKIFIFKTLCTIIINITQTGGVWSIGVTPMDNTCFGNLRIYKSMVFYLQNKDLICKNYRISKQMLDRYVTYLYRHDDIQWTYWNRGGHESFPSCFLLHSGEQFSPLLSVVSIV